MVLSIDVEKAYKVQHPCMIKALRNWEWKEIPQHNKGFEKAMANIVLNGEKLKAFPPKTKN